MIATLYVNFFLEFIHWAINKRRRSHKSLEDCPSNDEIKNIIARVHMSINIIMIHIFLCQFIHRAIFYKETQRKSLGYYPF